MSQIGKRITTMRKLTIFCEAETSAAEFVHGVLALPRRYGHVVSEARVWNDAMTVVLSDDKTADAVVLCLTEENIRVEG